MSEYDFIEYNDDLLPEEQEEDTNSDTYFGMEGDPLEDCLPEFDDYFVDDLDTIREIDFRELTGE